MQCSGWTIFCRSSIFYGGSAENGDILENRGIAIYSVDQCMNALDVWWSVPISFGLNCQKSMVLEGVQEAFLRWSGKEKNLQNTEMQEGMPVYASENLPGRKACSVRNLRSKSGSVQG